MENNLTHAHFRTRKPDDLPTDERVTSGGLPVDVVALIVVVVVVVNGFSHD